MRSASSNRRKEQLMNPQARNDLTRITLTVVIIGVLIAGSLWTLLPFLGALIWAATIVVATWPLLLWIERAAGGRRSVATAVMTAVMLVIFIVPFTLAIGVLLDAASQGLELVRTLATQGLPPPPGWIAKVPWVGRRIAEEWQQLAAGGPEALAETVRPYVRSAATWVLSMTGGLGIVIVHFILTVIIAAILYSQGESAANGVLMFARRIGRERGEQVIILAGQAVRGVALGVIVTALVQSLLAGLGLWVSGVPHAGLLLAVIFVLGVAQLGPLPVLLPAVIWLFWSGSTGWGSAMLVWTVLVGALDNVLRPILIRRGVNLPMLLIIAGVIGGLIAFGVVGLFIGPVMLAVTYTLLQSWISDDKEGAH
jgi:predicted PurR-regulated permease PerM